MKKIIILAIATLSTGIVLSSNLRKNEVVAIKAMPVKVQNDVVAKVKINNAPSYDVLASGD